MPTASKIAAATAVAVLLTIGLLVAALTSVVGALFGTASHPSTTALTDVPAAQLNLYQQAATTCPGLDWTVLAAIGKIESDHGRSALPGVHNGENPYHAAGPMQIIPSTWDSILARHQIPPGGATPPSRYNPHDAIYAAAFLLCDNGAGTDLRAAIFAYNHSTDYVNAVLTQAARYTTAPPAGTCDPAQATGSASPRALIAIAFACTQLGQPYVWGGDGGPDGGFDCSGLTAAAYGAAGTALPRTADTQYRAGPPVPDGQPLLPGDLVFYGATDHIHHVALYLGNGQVINAPTFGQPVRVQPARYRGDDYAGATRPATDP